MIVRKQIRMKGSDMKRLRKKMEEHWGAGEYLVTTKYSESQKEKNWDRRNQDIGPLKNMND